MDSIPVNKAKTNWTDAELQEIDLIPQKMNKT